MDPVRDLPITVAAPISRIALVAFGYALTEEIGNPRLIRGCAG